MLFDHSVVAVFGFRRGDVADGLEQPAMVEPVHPFERGEFDGLERPPRPTPIDDLGLVEAVDGFGERVVVAVANAADGWFDTGLGQALSVFYGTYCLGSTGRRNACVRCLQCLLECIEDEACVRRP